MPLSPLSEPQTAVQRSRQAEGSARSGAPAPIDEEKVQRLRAAIQAGKLKIDAQVIAERLVDELFPSTADEREN